MNVEAKPSKEDILRYIMRLPKETQVRKALEQCFRPCGKKRSHPEILWLRMIKTNLAYTTILLDITNYKASICSST